MKFATITKPVVIFLTKKVIWLCTLLLVCLTIPTPANGQTYSIKLAWDKVEFENSAGLIPGYKIHYKTGVYAGPPYSGTGVNQGDSPVSIPVTTLANPDSPEYTISGLEQNSIYYLAATAYLAPPGSPGTESDYSNEVILNDADRDRMADDWEISNGFDPANASDAYLDSDNDGYPNVTEYGSRTDPHNPESYPTLTSGLDHITVTDVTPAGFSVVWQAGEPSTCGLVVYNESGTHLTNIDTVCESASNPPAEKNGVMKVRVSNLEANKVYRFQTLTMSKQSSQIIVYPYPELIEVKTESSDLVVINDSVKQKLYDKDGNPAGGTLLLASVTGSNYPITAWVGEDVASPWARVDLSRFYSSVNHMNLQLKGGEELTLWGLGGTLGSYLNIQKIIAPVGQEVEATPGTAHLGETSAYYLDLKTDLNVVGLPVQPATPFTSYTLLGYLDTQAGGNDVADSIKRYNRQTGKWETASWFTGQPAGIDFPIEPGQAYLIYMKQDLNDVPFQGIPLGKALDLTPGLNLVCLPAAAQGFTYTSYEMLEDLGREQQVSYIRRYDPSEGWQTTLWIDGQASNDLFDTKEGEGYFIYMKEGKAGWRPY